MWRIPNVKQWLTTFGDHIIGRHHDVREALNWAQRVVGWERNVRIIAPNGVRLNVQAASFLA